MDFSVNNNCFHSFFQGSRDNLSFVLVTFPGVPQPSSEAIQQEAELEASLERRITGKSYSICVSHC